MQLARSRKWLLLPAALGLVLLLHGTVLDYALLGHDTYPVVAAARIHDAASFCGTFTEELMDGRFPKGHFYRPLLNLSFALDHALWGLDAFGYHLTDLLLLGLCVFFTATLPLPGRKGPSIATVVAGLLLAIHPVWGDLLPVAPRRGDILVLLFTLLALRPRAGNGIGRLGVPALFALLAVASKETGLLVLPLLVLRNLASPPPDGGTRLGRATRAAILPLVALAFYAAARHVVLGGLEGQGIFSISGFADRSLFALPRLLELTFLPAPALAPLVSGAAGPAAIVAILMAAALLVAVVLLLRRARAGRAVLLCAGWFLIAWLVHGLSQVFSPWYALHTVVPALLLLGLIAEAANRLLADGGAGAAARAGAVAILLAVTGLAVTNAAAGTAGSRLTISAECETFLARLERRIGRMPPGAAIEAPRIPRKVLLRAGAADLRVPCLSDYSLQAWADLVFGESAVRIAYGTPKPAPPAPDEKLVIIRSRIR